MIDGPSKRDIQILAAWYFAGGKYEQAATALGIGRQPVMNALYRFRRLEKLDTNLELALRYQTQIHKLRGKPLGKPAKHGKKAA